MICWHKWQLWSEFQTVPVREPKQEKPFKIYLIQACKCIKCGKQKVRKIVIE